MVSVEVISQTAREGEGLTGKACDGPPVPQDWQVLGFTLQPHWTFHCSVRWIHTSPPPPGPAFAFQTLLIPLLRCCVLGATAMGGWVCIPAAGRGHLCHGQGSVDPRGNEAMVLRPLPEALRTVGRCLEGRSSVDTEFQPGSGADRWARAGPGCGKGPHFILSSDGLER